MSLNLYIYTSSDMAEAISPDWSHMLRSPGTSHRSCLHIDFESGLTVQETYCTVAKWIMFKDD